MLDSFLFRQFICFLRLIISTCNTLYSTFPSIMLPRRSILGLFSGYIPLVNGIQCSIILSIDKGELVSYITIPAESFNTNLYFRSLKELWLYNLQATAKFPPCNHLSQKIISSNGFQLLIQYRLQLCV